MEVEQIEENEESGELELNPIKVPQYLIDIYNFIQNQKIPESFNLTYLNTMDAIIYGISCKKQIKSNKYVNCVIFQANPETQIISVAIQKTNELEHIDLTQITNISLFPNKNPTITININSLTINFEFTDIRDLLLLLKSFLLLFEKYILNDENLLRNKALKIWQKYDTDFNNKLDFKEFTQFFHDLNLSNSNSLPITKEELFRILDTNKNGVIDYEEFLNFYLTFTNGAEFQEVFLKYSSDLLYLSVKDLQNFSMKEQKERFTLEKCAFIILSFKQNLSNDQKRELTEKIKNKVKLTQDELNIFQMTLAEFKLYLISSQNSALLIKDDKNEDMSHPLNDYFINSTHNTYLSGHQITGSSTAEMYGIVLVNGCKLVEIDCYNIDDTGDVVVTHGYTIVNKIHLTEIFEEIKAKAFSQSNYPVIFSVENHMDEKSQEIFVEKCKTILKNFYIIEENNLPKTYPSPLDLREKYIIELGGRRYFLPKEESSDIEMKSENKKEILEMINSKIENPEHPLKRKSALKPKEEDSENDKPSPKKEKKEPTSETGEALDKMRGLFKIKFDINTIKEDNPQPWEYASMKCSKLLNYSSHSESRRALIQFNSKSFTKTYPINFDSSNYDIIKAWLTGTQIASINYQCLEDDFTLINKIFFEAFGNTGYVLKPKKFWKGSKTFELYDFPFGTVSIDIINVIGLDDIIHKEGLMIEDNANVVIEEFIIGSQSDDSRNQKYTMKVSGNFILPTIEKVNSSFDIYEKDLCHFYFRVLLNNKVIARSALPICSMKEGIKSIELYDNKCVKYPNSVLIAKIKKNIKPYKMKY